MTAPWTPESGDREQDRREREAAENEQQTDGDVRVAQAEDLVDGCRRRAPPLRGRSPAARRSCFRCPGGARRVLSRSGLVLTTRGPITEQPAEGLADLDRRPTLDIVRAVVRGHGEVLEAVAAAEPAIAALADAAAERSGRVIYVGAGSGGRIAALDASEWGPTFNDDRAIALHAGADEVPGSPAEAAAEDDAEAGAAAIRELAVGGDDVVVGVTASGTTRYVLGALAAARAVASGGEAAMGGDSAVCGEAAMGGDSAVCGDAAMGGEAAMGGDAAMGGEAALGGGAATARRPLIAAVTCAPFAGEADHRIEVPVGPEVIAGSTRLKAGTAQKLVLNAFSTAVMVRRGRTYGNLMAGMRVANDKLRGRALAVCVLATGCGEDDARAALKAAHDDVGCAIVMLAGNVDAATAKERLRATQGAIRRAAEKWS
jgi:N-acetylmuramic acid 6-phosphate etherase